MSNAATPQKKGSFSSLFSTLVIPLAILTGILIYMFVMGNPGNFEENDPTKHPVPDGVGHVLGLIYKGGTIVPILLSLILMNITFSIERFIAIAMAGGKQSSEAFVHSIKSFLRNGQIDQAIAACDAQKGSLANVIKSSLRRYKEVENASDMDKEAKVTAIKLEVEEATSLELPGLEKNLSIIATMASVSTLIALLGTVLGMIRAFSALATAGSPDSVALANGISEALINTALGIANSAVAIIMYNVFTSKIDVITYTIDEAGFSIVQTFEATHK